MIDGQKLKRQQGTVSWRCNNPGNLKFGKFAQSMHAIGSDHIGHAVFPTYDFGKTAQYMLLFSDKSRYLNKTLFDAISTYAPTSDNNDPKKYTEYLHDTTGIPGDQVLATLTGGQRSDLLEAMKIYEGFKIGLITEL